MTQKHRISTNIGKDQVIKVELKQDFDLLEILSLKFTQKEVYTSLCADYGVVCGRISVNNGLGVPNAKISIFIPLSEEDENDPRISQLYPYKSSTSDVSEEGYRYNLLPSRKQHGGHEPTGTFPDQSLVLNREEYLEVFEKYYKYTVKTNTAGDFMIWGVPIGQQTLHVDVDLSDVGCFSLRPYDFIKQGLGEDAFKNTYTYKSSSDLSSLPQIVTFDKTIDVFPFWGNEDLCEIGITRTDFDLSDRGVKIEPKAFLIGGTYTDTGKNSLNKNCQPKVKMGRKCDLTTKTGKIESIRFTHQKDITNRPVLERYEIDQDIPDDGGFVMELPMNTEFLYTNEFGENEITNDPNKGVPTAACYRLRFSLDDSGNDRVRKTASYLVPNIREYSGEENESYAFSTSWDDYPTNSVSTDSNRGILYNEFGQYYPRDYFYRVTYNKVYTISSFQNIHYDGSFFRNDRYVGIKEIVPSEEEDCSSEIVTPPVNFGKRNRTFTLLISSVLLFLEHLLNLLTLTFTNQLVRLLFTIGDGADFRPIRKLARSIKKAAFRAQENGQRRLYLINYPECEECNGTNTLGTAIEGGSSSAYCSVGSATIAGDFLENDRILSVTSLTFTADSTGDCPGEDINALGAALISGGTGILYFINNQSNYQLSSETYGNLTLTNEFSGTPVLDASGNTISYSAITFNDIGVLFDEPSLYTITLRSNVDKESTDTPITGYLEEGCDLYDTPYDEDLVSWYYPNTGYTDYNWSGTISPASYVAGTTSVVATNITGTNYGESLKNYGSTLSPDIKYYESSGVPLVDSFDGEDYEKLTRSGMSEFENGVFTIVPGTQQATRVWEILREYYRRKRVGKLFCGGIVNYSFIDNWLSGSLYFFQFKGKNSRVFGRRYCEDVVRYVSSQDRFYYRSAIYTSESNWGGDKPTQIGRPTTMVDLGPRDEFIKEICIDPTLDPNCSVSRSIGSTSFQSFGELLGLAINYRMDTSNNDFQIEQFFDNGGFTFSNEIFDGDILQLISINNEVGIEEFDLQNPKYLGYSYQVLDPDVYPDVFKNGTSVYGPLPVTFFLDEDGERVRSCLNEPTHISNDGTTQVQGRLTESSQKVPFFLWDKGGTGFGPYNETTLDNQSWDYGNVQVQPLQGMTYSYNLTGSTDDSSDKYLLLPMTYTFSGLTIDTGLNVTNDIEFDAIYSGTSTGYTIYDAEYPGFTVLRVTGGSLESPTSGTLHTRYGSEGNWEIVSWVDTNDFIIRRTQDYYTGNKQILSTPFMFYFGLRVGKTGLDKFVEFFGDKGAFTSAE
jgi:hypothetical protein